MTKDKVIHEIDFIKSQRTDQAVNEYLDKVKDYVLSQSEINNVKLHNYIQNLMPTKMGGIYLQIASSLMWLKRRLKRVNKENHG